MSKISLHIRHCMFYQFQLGDNASAGARHIRAALGVADRTCQDWFRGFHEGNTSLEDLPRSGRPLD